MGFYCHVIVGAFCLNAPVGDTAVKINNVGFGSATVIQASDWEASFLTVMLLIA